MNEQRSMLQVYFEDPFWVGLFQRWESGKLRVCKVTFGAEPKEQELYCFLQTRYAALAFGPAVPDSEKPLHKNPKRRQRAAQRLLLQSGASTKSQQALKLQQQERMLRLFQVVMPVFMGWQD